MGIAVDSSRIDGKHHSSDKMIKICLAFLLVASCLARPQQPGYTPEQLAVIRSHEAIAQANAPSPFKEQIGWQEHQDALNAVLALQGISPGQSAHDNAIASVKAAEAQLTQLHY